MKKYRLKKSYPGSPELGFITDETMYFPASYPEFWELVKNDGFEIINYIAKSLKNTISCVHQFSVPQPWKGNDEWKINSIKRLSDNETFSIGDKCNLKNGNGYRNPILRFEIRNESWGLEKYRNKDRLVVFLETMYKTEWGPIELDSIVMSKQPLFTTEDKVEIFEDQQYWFVCYQPDWYYKSHTMGKSDRGYCALGEKQFSTEKAAKDWINLNKPQYSLQNIQRAFNINGGVCCYNDFIKELSHD